MSRAMQNGFFSGPVILSQKVTIDSVICIKLFSGFRIVSGKYNKFGKIQIWEKEVLKVLKYASRSIL